jgi:hypothetical protein
MNYTKTALALGSAIGVRELIQSLDALNFNDILGVVGLERRPSPAARTLPAIGLIVVSAAVGACQTGSAMPSIG